MLGVEGGKLMMSFASKWSLAERVKMLDREGETDTRHEPKEWFIS